MITPKLYNIYINPLKIVKKKYLSAFLQFDLHFVIAQIKISCCFNTTSNIISMNLQPNNLVKEWATSCSSAGVEILTQFPMRFVNYRQAAYYNDFVILIRKRV